MRKSILPVESDSEGKGSGGRYDYGFEILQRKTLEIKGKISFRGQERERDGEGQGCVTWVAALY